MHSQSSSQDILLIIRTNVFSQCVLHFSDHFLCFTHIGLLQIRFLRDYIRSSSRRKWPFLVLISRIYLSMRILLTGWRGLQTYMFLVLQAKQDFFWLNQGRLRYRARAKHRLFADLGRRFRESAGVTATKETKRELIDIHLKRLRPSFAVIETTDACMVESIRHRLISELSFKYLQPIFILHSCKELFDHLRHRRETKEGA